MNFLLNCFIQTHYKTLSISFPTLYHLLLKVRNRFCQTKKTSARVLFNVFAERADKKTRNLSPKLSPTRTASSIRQCHWWSSNTSYYFTQKRKKKKNPNLIFKINQLSIFKSMMIYLVSCHPDVRRVNAKNLNSVRLNWQN